MLEFLARLEYLFGGAKPIGTTFLPLRGAVAVKNKKKALLVGVSPYYRFVSYFGVPKSSEMLFPGAFPAMYFSKFGITAIFDAKGICSVLSVRFKPAEDLNCFSGEVFIPPRYFIPSHSRLGLGVGAGAFVGALEAAGMPEKYVRESPYGTIWSYHLEREDWGDSFNLEISFSRETGEIIDMTCIAENR